MIPVCVAVGHGCGGRRRYVRRGGPVVPRTTCRTMVATRTRCRGPGGEGASGRCGV